MSFNGTVLVTDDEPHIRKFLSLVLKRMGQPVVVEAANGREAIDLCREHRPDLILLDVNMPVLDGLQALAEIRRDDPEALVIMLTSLTNRQTVEDCVRLGAACYLRKDLPRDELIAELSRVIAENFQPEDEAPAIP